jgi:multiple sugar transport system permease protein
VIGPADRAMTAPSSRAWGGRWSSLTRQERLAYRLLFPVLGVVFVVVTVPFLLAVAQSLQTNSGDFAGLQNYGRALSNPFLYQALQATAVYGTIVLPAEILLGMGLALLVHRTVRSRALRAILYVLAIVPLVIPAVAIGVVARLIYAPQYGVLNYLLQLAGLIKGEISWLGTPWSAMLAVSSVDIWQWTPFVYIVIFAGLQTVPHETVEAAQVDGASSWAQFWHIELPYLRSLLVLVLFFRIADTLRAFDHIFILTGGGPGASTDLLSLYLYRIGFKFSDLGQAAALSVIVMVAVSLLYTAVTRLLPLERD